MRAALLIVLGLAIGIIGTVFTMNALHQRNPLPRSVMTVMAYHAGELKRAVKAQRCDAEANRNHLQQLQMTAKNIEPAFASADAPFFKEADKLHDALGSALQSAPLDCPSLAAALKPVGDACQSCHQQYR